ncbi:MAG TPA: tRNA preQ1(34) S-adenosylmethionine ribosyltransferase-isomerase QueA [Dissulfurispiraceae bacterium]|nr:tRNA preQ1(34) S-adenosylmethionine ribosyltransferase-isomerase QueA [Dissulfurispiraceae bacterium]
MKTADFDFNLPADLIALRPAQQRDCSRLLVLHKGGEIEHRTFCDIVDYLDEGDLLILNDTKVLPARLIASKPSGGKVDLIIVKVGDNGACEILCRGGYEGPVYLGDGTAAIIYFEASHSGAEKKRYLKFGRPEAGGVGEILERCGLMPLPPYIKRRPDDNDRERYQTVYAEKGGSIAAPTAGLHFTERVLRALTEKGVHIRKLTLHVGQGTFKPITANLVRDHEMQSEYFEMPLSLLDDIGNTKKSGRKVITVGTTSTRALEGFLSGIYHKSGNGDGTVRGLTDIFIHPGYRFGAVDALLTNLHLPRSTPLMLSSAICGRETLLRAYEEAISMGYRFFSYGDAMLIL